MNYIKKLQSDLRETARELVEMNEQLTELQVYLNSSKFNCGDPLDGYVNVKDVLARIETIKLS